MLRLALSQPATVDLALKPPARRALGAQVDRALGAQVNRALGAQVDRALGAQVDLRHRDLPRLEQLREEYFGHADDLEMVTKSSRAA